MLLGTVRSVIFTLLPAVDVSDGRAVRVVRGEAGTETTHGTPRDAALAWQAEGAEWIHLVDLDAAFGRGSNAEVLAAVIGELDVKVELSGGIRDDASLEWALSTGSSRVILATAALEDPAWCARAITAHGERIAVALDVRVTNRTSATNVRQSAGYERVDDVDWVSDTGRNTTRVPTSLDTVWWLPSGFGIRFGGRSCTPRR